MGCTNVTRDYVDGVELVIIKGLLNIYTSPKGGEVSRLILLCIVLVDEINTVCLNSFMYVSVIPIN